VVEAASLAARIGGDDGGIVVTGSACASWAVDGGAVHVYDVAGEPDDLPAMLRALDAVGRRSFAAVLTASLFDGDPVLAALTAEGFVTDWEESDVRAGVAAKLVGLVREIA
jgi:hypothetical protein